jgi:hypothetical protein
MPRMTTSPSAASTSRTVSLLYPDGRPVPEFLLYVDGEDAGWRWSDETHHQVFRIVDGADGDWASWYAQWLIDLSELPGMLGVRPVHSELIYLLVSLDKQVTAEAAGEPWETYYARHILRHFQPSAG